MADINYKDIINLATAGFRNIQNALAGLSADSGVSAVTTNTNTHSGNITPAAMVTAIGNLATVKKSNTSTNSVTDSNGYIHGRIAYKGSVTVDDSISFSGNGATLSKTLPAGYYAGITISSSGTVPGGSITISGGGLATESLASSNEVANAFTPTAIVNASGATASGYSYAKISRAGISSSVNPGYITSGNVTNNVGTSKSISYVKIPNATYKMTNAVVNLAGELVQSEYEGSTALSTTPTVLTSTQPTGSAAKYYKFVYTPSSTVSSNGKGQIDATGYARSNEGKTDIGVDVNTVTKHTMYVLKSIGYVQSKSGLSFTTNVDLNVGYGEAARLPAGYYPSERKIFNSIGAANISATNTIQQNATKFYDGSSNSNSEILLSSTSGLTRYYTISVTNHVDKTITSAGYISSSEGTFNLPSDGNITRYIPEAAATITNSKTATPNIRYTLIDSNSQYLFNLVEGDQHVKSGIVTTAPDGSGDAAGTTYWKIEANAYKTADGSAKATVNISRAGYLKEIRSGLLSEQSVTVSPTIDSTKASFFLKKAGLTVDGTSSVSNNTVSTTKPTISLNSSGTNISASAATTTKPGSGYYVAVKTSQIANAGSVTITPRYKVSQGGYLPYSTSYVNGSAIVTTATVPESSVTYIPIASGVSHNGYVTTSGWIPTPTNHYTTTYDATEECVDFIFND